MSTMDQREACIRFDTEQPAHDGHAAMAWGHIQGALKAGLDYQRGAHSAMGGKGMSRSGTHGEG